MIKSREALDKIIEQFYGERTVNPGSEINDDFLKYLKEKDRLKTIIETWNTENRELIEQSDILDSKGLSWKLMSTRRLVMHKYPELILPAIEFPEELEHKYLEIRSKLKRER